MKYAQIETPPKAATMIAVLIIFCIYRFLNKILYNNSPTTQANAIAKNNTTIIAK